MCAMNAKIWMVGNGDSLENFQDPNDTGFNELTINARRYAIVTLFGFTRCIVDQGFLN